MPEYRIVSEPTHPQGLAELSRKVNQSMADGWTPQGGIAVLPAQVAGGLGRYHQAMVLEKARHLGDGF